VGTRSSVLWLVVAWVVALPFAAAALSAAQERSVWDGVYTESQADRGKAVYEKECAFCHQSDLRGQGFAPALIEETFSGRWQDGYLGDLFIVVQMTMPQDKPASLTQDQYAEIVAYLLKANKYPAGQQDLANEPKLLAQIAFKRPDGK
jgi:mono/diheme cytochrome c family protein